MSDDTLSIAIILTVDCTLHYDCPHHKTSVFGQVRHLPAKKAQKQTFTVEQVYFTVDITPMTLCMITN